MIRRILRNPSLAVDIVAAVFFLSIALIAWLCAGATA